MPPLLVRLNLPGFSLPEPFRLENAPMSMTGLACAVLKEIGGFSDEELQVIREDSDRVPLTLLGELCAGQLIELASDAELEVFLKTADTPRGPAIIEVRPRGNIDTSVSSLGDGLGNPEDVSQKSTLESPEPTYSTNGCRGNETAPQIQSEVCGPPSEVRPGGHSGGDANGGGGLERPRRPPEASGFVAVGSPPPGQFLLELSPVLPGTQSPANGTTSHTRLPTMPNDEAHQQTPAEANGSFDSAVSAQPDSLQVEQRVQTPDAQRRKNMNMQRGGRTNAVSERRSPNHYFHQSQDDPHRMQDFTGGPERSRCSPSTGATDQGTTRALRGANSASRPYCQRERDAPIHIRLYQEKDDRRRRLDEARIRQREQEEEDIRTAAQRALGRASSPVRCQSPSRFGSREEPLRQEPVSHCDAQHHLAHSMRAHTPPRTRHPLPERSASGGAVRRRSGTGGGGSTQGGRGSTHGDQHGGASRNGSRLNNSYKEADVAAAAAAPLTASSVRSLCSAALADGSTIASESGAPGLHSTNSAATLGGEESLCGDAAPVVGEDLQSLRQMVIIQQRRITLLESMHQQALRQLRKAREELSCEQQKGYREADKVLGLEELISDMQAQGYDSDNPLQMHWEEWLQRSRAIIESG